MDCTLREYNDLSQEQNYRINDAYWTNGMYLEGCDNKLIAKHFSDMLSFNDYHRSMMHKVRTRAIKYSMTTEEIISDIVNVKSFRNTFAKDVIKQGTNEKFQKEYMYKVALRLNKKFSKIRFTFSENVDKYVVNDHGQIISKLKEKQDMFKESKQFDGIFTITNKGKRRVFFIDFKHTQDRGGSQDNTCREMQDTYKYCKLNNEEDVFFYFVLDGNYWSEQQKNIKQTKKIYRSTIEYFEENIVNFVKDNIRK